MFTRSKQPYVLIFLLAAISFVPFLSQVHLFDWDEINFAEAAREMLATGNYGQVQINFQPFFEKPPLFIWMQALSMKLFGVNEFAARFPNAVAGIITLLSLFRIGTRQRNKTLGWVWVGLYLGSWLPQLYFHSGIIDPWFNLFIFFGVYQFYNMLHGDQLWRNALLGGLFLGAAVLTKGPVALLVFGITTLLYLLLYNEWKRLRVAKILAFLGTCLLVIALWVGVEIYQHGTRFIVEFLVYQVRLFRTEDAGHGGPFYYHFLILLLGCFPASVLLFQYVGSAKSENHLEENKAFRRLMFVLFWSVLLLFSIVKTKIVHYSSLCYFPLTYVAALVVTEYLNGSIRWNRAVRGLFATIGILLGIALALLPLLGKNISLLIPYIKDPFAVGNLQAPVHWHYAASLIGIAYFFGILYVSKHATKNPLHAVRATFLLHLVTIPLALAYFTPRIEAISQRAAISFYKDLQGADVYVQVLDFKSYAHLFYQDKQPGHRIESLEQEWLLNGPIDKPAYFVTKIQQAEKYRAMPQLGWLKEENGFVFFKRDLQATEKSHGIDTVRIIH